MDAIDETKVRRRSILTQRGDEARDAAQRELLRATLIAHGWNVTHTARALGMGDPPAVHRAIRALGLTAEYEKARGWVKVAV